MLPFGRIARDIVGPHNLIDNPYQIAQKWTGLPIREVFGKLKESKDKSIEDIMGAPE